MRYLGLFFVLLVVIIPRVSLALVTGFSFTQVPQSLAVGDSSCKITLSSNDKIPETYDIFLESTGDGEFSSSESNWQSVSKLTMSTNTSNRSFYFRGFSAGDVSINAIAEARSGEQRFTAQTTISVGDVTNCSDDGGGDVSSSSTPPYATPVQSDAGKSNGNVSTFVSAVIPEVIVEGVPARFQGIVEKYDGSKTVEPRRGRFEWSMGDGASYAYEKNTDVIHTYHHAGTYTIVFRYYPDFFTDEAEEIFKQSLTVVDDALLITSVNENGGITLKNNSVKEIDLGGWTIIRGGVGYVFPDYTYIDQGRELTIPLEVHRLSGEGNVFLDNGYGSVVSTYYRVPEVPVLSIQSTSTVKQSAQTKKKVSQNNDDDIIQIIREENRVSDEQIEATQQLSFSETQLSGKRVNSPHIIVLFTLLVFGVAVIYSVYAYANRSAKHNDMGHDGGMDEARDYDIEEIIKSSE